MSMHSVPNAWHVIQFCDLNLGIHRATPAEVLHCLQVGIFHYSLDGLFEQMKKRKS
jgi:hypothetical protein